MKNRWGGGFPPSRGENTFGSVKSPSCLFCFTKSTFHPLQKKKRHRIPPTACGVSVWVRVAGSRHQLSKGHHPSSEGAAWRKTTRSSGSADRPRGRFFKRQEALEASTRQRCEKRRGKEAEDKPSQALNTFEQEFLHSAPQLEEERVWPSSPPPPAKAEGLSSGCFIPGPSLARYFLCKRITLEAALRKSQDL